MKRTAIKGCFLCLFVVVVVIIGIVAWQVLSNDDQESASGTGGLFGGGLFGDNNETTTTTREPSATPGPTGLRNQPTVSPTAAPSIYRYPYTFNRCSSDASQCCNGLENLCDWPVNEVLFGMVHNAMATAADKFLFPNHERSMSEALEAGYRGINFDVCRCSDSYKLCHGVCGVGEVDPTQAFTRLVSFLNENPNEVLLVNLEINEGVNLNDFNNRILSRIEGFSDMLYVHSNVSDSWPTLGSMIQDNKRIIAFHHKGPTCRNEGDCPVGLHYYFANVMEAEFQLDSIEAILDTETSCVVTRGATSSSGAFFGVNNFITTGDIGMNTMKQASATANAYDFARNRIQDCSAVAASEQPNLPGPTDVNLFYVDFWSLGDVVQVVQEHNQNLGSPS